ncbi:MULTISPECIES: carboxymuconolactone decarboxylase family protein [unclassified Gilliamella]|uniref:carboxymuconolactone decarboxylase family protein n=1 Tax=unclassified Gilliamella TaxID=2685620 RepID=UPI002269A068|nr:MULTISPECIES: carboxymuconolactone decarboxylase family protein [unclassified Gilliamella]MCX8641778.1 carboxymuconolactone decarboxylase family protein [Gilliamella sp. B3835]MCX8706578.1 carboxymuconolactone decarboxylase family protein [Gilliamella sp. B3783]MCX8708953.1 carboxymuconolactone decarboxylase family protein [Gilliamella sp. B3780]MCX8714451.1 carboxymuconolactone decarboxylase family protein [Gilliamella sp. B3781]MCX8715818.1 carboxymuconolactone decarboxylase family protei
MTQSRHENGLNNIEQLYGELGANGLTQNAQLAPKFDEYICDFAYGDIYSRKSLSLLQKQLITISSLITQGCVEDELKMHIHGGLNAGLTEEQVLDICVHCLPYVGFPKVTSALKTAHQVFNERKK